MSTQASHPSSTEAHSTDEVEQTYRKVILRLMPFLILCYIVSYLDRANISFAKLQFMNDLGFSEAAYGLGAGLFFVSYPGCHLVLLPVRQARRCQTTERAGKGHRARRPGRGRAAGAKP